MRRQLLNLNQFNLTGVTGTTFFRSAVNYAGLQIGWLACALGAAWGYPWVGPLVVAGHVALHLGWMTRTRPRAEVIFILLVSALGLLVDGAQKASGLLTYASDNSTPWLAPYWIVAMWALFATSFSTSLKWVPGRYWLAAVLGAIFGPLSYAGGAQLGGIEFNYPYYFTMLVMGLIWAGVMVALAWLAASLRLGSR
jgi:hypothetical protein